MSDRVTIDYTNHHGERSLRQILPLASGLKFDCNEWHPEVQWLLTAFDVEKRVWRDFAMRDIHSWRFPSSLTAAPADQSDALLARQLQPARRGDLAERLEYIINHDPGTTAWFVKSCRFEILAALRSGLPAADREAIRKKMKRANWLLFGAPLQDPEGASREIDSALALIGEG